MAKNSKQNKSKKPENTLAYDEFLHLPHKLNNRFIVVPVDMLSRGLSGDELMVWMMLWELPMGTSPNFLRKVLPFDEEEVRKILRSLKRRKYVYEERAMYKGNPYDKFSAVYPVAE